MATILLVEPDPKLQTIYRSALIARGHQVTVSSTCDQAIGALDAGRFDTIILELQIASHNGLELLYEMRSYTEWQNIPVIIHTVIPIDELQHNTTLQLCTISSFLYKPKTKLSQLVSVVESTVQVPSL